MDSEENGDTSDPDVGDSGVAVDSDTNAFVETMSEAFEDVFEFGPTVDTSSRPIDDEVAAARQTDPGSPDETAPTTADESTSALAVSGASAEAVDGRDERPRTVVSDRGVDEVFDTLDEHSDPPW
jgi:hypothetical protein